MCVCICVCSAGYYTHVSTLADVQENVMEYLHVLSRPMVINHDHDIIWTEAYMDSVVSLLLSLSCVSIIWHAQSKCQTHLGRQCYYLRSLCRWS